MKRQYNITIKADFSTARLAAVFKSGRIAQLLNGSELRDDGDEDESDSPVLNENDDVSDESSLDEFLDDNTELQASEFMNDESNVVVQQEEATAELSQPSSSASTSSSAAAGSFQPEMEEQNIVVPIQEEEIGAAGSSVLSIEQTAIAGPSAACELSVIAESSIDQSAEPENVIEQPEENGDETDLVPTQPNDAGVLDDEEIIKKKIAAAALKQDEDDESDNEKIYTCKLCDTKFTRKRLLHGHISKHLKNNELYTCYHCYYMCKTRIDIIKHIKKHKKEKNYKCKLCNYTTEKKFTFKVHMQGHKNVKSFRCNICNYGAYTIALLKLHQLKHNGEQLFNCHLCDYKSNFRQYMDRHLVSEHQNGKSHDHNNIDNNDNTIISHEMITSNEFKYTCDKCNFKTNHLKNLRRHKRAVHNNLLNDARTSGAESTSDE